MLTILKDMEPQKTCKLFGAIRAVLGIRDALPLIHGPVGCAYHIRYLLSVRSGMPLKILTTEMNQNDVIFGAEDKLEEEIIKTDKTYSPNLIVVLSSCASSIIGEDIERVIRKTKDRIKAEIIGVSAGGFEGTQIDGYEECLSSLIRLMDEQKSKKDSINLVSQFRGGPDLDNLKKCFDRLKIEINCVLTSGSTLKSVKNAGRASLNVPMCDASGITPCEIMHEKFDIPFLYEVAPIGVSSTSNFFQGICDFFNVEYRLKNEEDMVKRKIKKDSKYLSDGEVAIVAGSTRAIALTDFVCELDMEPILVCLDFSGKYTMKNLARIVKKNGVNPVILKEPEYHEVLEHIEKLKPDLILGGLGEIGPATKANVPLLDVMHAQKITMGFEGAINLSKNIKEILVG